MKKMERDWKQRREKDMPDCCSNCEYWECHWEFPTCALNDKGEPEDEHEQIDTEWWMVCEFHKRGCPNT
jgi:hypothetical protein